MTRYARSGNTQKHKKMPSDSTPWKELSQQTSDSNKTKKKRFNKTNSKTEISQDSVEKHQSESVIRTERIAEQNPSIETAKDESLLNISLSSEQLEEKLKVKNTPNQSSKEPSEDKIDIVEDTIEVDNGSEFIESKDEESIKKLKLDKKARKRKQHEIERAKKGIILLKPSIEKKLYNLRKALNKKSLPAETIKQILRKERRKAELNFRKNMHKTCFNCRQTGHILADCPDRAKSSNSGNETINQQTGICFKCGSTEHSSSKCSKRVNGYPFASCFVCKEQGHLSRDCPKNEHGIYIKGGKCIVCGNVNHLRKDCPMVKKKTNEEAEVSGDMIDKNTSVDAEVVEKLIPRTIKKTKKLKIVKF